MCMLEKQISSSFVKNEKIDRIYQGDLLSNISLSIISQSDDDNVGVTEINFPYVLVLSQDCDLKQFFDKQNSESKDNVFNQYIPNVLIAPCYYEEDFKSGENLSFLNISQARHSSEQMKLIKQERDPRYHYIDSFDDFNIPALYIDFKVYYTISPQDLFEKYENSYVATVNALFRERITQRYTNYISRIGLPCILK